MNKHEINLTFESLEESNKWVEENCPNRTYQGNAILMVQKETSTFDNHVTIKSIITF